jgi:hypothetical protein
VAKMRVWIQDVSASCCAWCISLVVELPSCCCEYIVNDGGAQE